VRGERRELLGGKKREKLVRVHRSSLPNTALVANGVGYQKHLREDCGHPALRGRVKKRTTIQKKGAASRHLNVKGPKAQRRDVGGLWGVGRGGGGVGGWGVGGGCGGGVWVGLGCCFFFGGGGGGGGGGVFLGGGLVVFFLWGGVFFLWFGGWFFGWGGVGWVVGGGGWGGGGFLGFFFWGGVYVWFFLVGFLLGGLGGVGVCGGGGGGWGLFGGLGGGGATGRGRIKHYKSCTSREFPSPNDKAPLNFMVNSLEASLLTLGGTCSARARFNQRAKEKEKQFQGRMTACLQGDQRESSMLWRLLPARQMLLNVALGNVPFKRKRWKKGKEKTGLERRTAFGLGPFGKS